MHFSNLRAALERRATVPVLCLLACLLPLSACQRKDSAGGDGAARVNGKKILRSEVDKYYKNQTAGSPEQPQGEQATSLQLNILNELIRNELMVQRAEKLGLLVSEEEVDGKVTEFKAPYTEEQFQQQLKDRNLTLEDLKQNIRRGLIEQKVFNKEITSKITISDADISNYYNQHKGEFNYIEPQYELAQILVTTQPGQVRNLRNDKAQNEAQARSKIQQLLNRLESGEEFYSVAMNFSDDLNTAPNGGVMGSMPESALTQTDPGTREAVMRLRAGEISGIIPVSMGPGAKMLYGFRIVKLMSKQPAGQREANDPRVQQFIREKLRQQREQLLRIAYEEVLRNEAKVENYLAGEVLKTSGQKN
jgi:peptidyl-prolyl cis-trans isomerase SurA